MELFICKILSMSVFKNQSVLLDNFEKSKKLLIDK